MRKLAAVTAAFLWLALPLGAQDHTSRWELTEQFIRDMWLHPVRAMEVTVLGAGPVHAPIDDCEIHIGATLKDQTISDFAHLILEPPNVCKDNRESSRAAWRTFYGTARDRDCEVQQQLKLVRGRPCAVLKAAEAVGMGIAFEPSEVGRIETVERDRVRIRPLPSSSDTP